MKKLGWDKAVPTAGRSKYGQGSLGWVLGQYRQSAAYKKLRPTTKKTYEQAFDRLHAYGKEDIAGLRRKHVIAIRDSLADTPAVANTVLTAFRCLCKWALDAELIEVDPTSRVETFKLGEWRRWSDHEIEHFYHETYEAVRRVMVMAIYTGQRRSDLCKALWSDIDGTAIRVVQQKTDARLWIPLHPFLRQHLAEWRKDVSTVHILAHSDRRPWEPGILSTAFSHEVKRLGMAGATIHGLRKTAAAKLAEVGCSTKQIMSITGHSSLSEVERYTREAEQRGMAESAMAMVESLPFKMVVKPLIRKG